MTGRLCAPCTKLVVERNAPGSLKGAADSKIEHHQNLAELRSCAKSQGRCLICPILWESVQQQCPAETVKHYLNNWNTDAALRRSKVFVRVVLSERVQDNVGVLSSSLNESNIGPEMLIDVDDDPKPSLFANPARKTLGRVNIFGRFGE